MDDLIDDEIRGEFLEEAKQCIDDCEEAFLVLEKDPSNQELLDQICRLAHNLKGGAQATGFSGLAELTHEMENFILKIKKQPSLASKMAINLLLSCADSIKINLPELMAHPSQKIGDASLIIQLASPELLTRETSSTESALKKLNNKENPIEAIPSQPKKEILRQPVPASKTDPDESIRVRLSRLDKLNNYVGELVILQGMLSQQINGSEATELRKSVNQLSKLSKEIHGISMSLRMVPIQGILKRMRRVVRDTSEALQKEVNLQITGENTEVDKTVLERLNDPLTHMIRNALDHGLEPTKDRLNCGKPLAGLLEINCFHEGNRLVLEIIDDGKGINPEQVRLKAIEKGIVNAQTQLSEEQCLDLIFQPGFSTKDNVSEISGRGVGMDVVKNNIHTLSGDIQISSEIGNGTKFRISLPLSVAVIDGMITQVGEHRYVLPSAQVYETVKIDFHDLNQTKAIGLTYRLRGDVIPVVFAHHAINENIEQSNAFTAVVSKRGSTRHMLVVDNIIGQQQVVVKPLGQEVPYRTGFMGSSILGDGLPALILDLYEFIDLWAPHARKVLEYKGVANG